MYIETHTGIIKILEYHEIFTFGSNLQGFHGAGAAGFATFGVFGNQWRKFNYGDKPAGWKGLWTVKGRSEGLQHGTNGWSYAIPTVEYPGARKSLPGSVIVANIQLFYTVAKRNPSWKFMVAYSSNSRNLNGYTPVEMARFFAEYEPPVNVIFEKGFSSLVYSDEIKANVEKVI